MNRLRTLLFVVIIAMQTTSCRKTPGNTTPDRPTTATAVSQSVTPISPTTQPTEVVGSATPQASPSPIPATQVPGAPTPTTRATEVTAAATSTSATSPCLDEAVFVGDVSVPDGTIYRPGEAFTKTWRVKNTGTCTWGAGYSLIYSSGDIMNGAFNNPIGPISPGELADISVELAAPARGGEHIGYWQFQNAAGQPFGVGYNGGGPLWVKINATFFNPNPQPTAVVIMPPVTSGPSPTSSSTLSSSPTPGALVLAPTEPPSAGCAPQQNNAYIDQMLSLINQARADNGLQPVFLQSQLSAAAIKHSTDMACNRFVDHHGSDGSTWYSRVEAEGYANPRSARENIKVGTDVQDTFNWWMGSQVHRDNILFPTVTEVGIGYVYLPGSEYGSYFTLLLARR
jgi:uncharacterized protein YkwD